LEPLMPPGLSECDWSRAVDRFTAALGTHAVHTDGEALREFRDPYTFAGWERFWASAVLMPDSAEQVREIVVLANEFGIPLWPSSQGRNNAYGGPAPRVHGSVQVSLRRMNRVLEVDEDHGYVLLEPGVRFADLYAHLREHGHRLWPPMPDIAWGSVVGNTLDHGVGYTVPGQHASRACGMEVVLPNGEMLRTGMGALPGSRTWQTYQRGFGPSLDTLFMQSNLGIVTKMGTWCMPEPECFMACSLVASEEDSLAAIVDALRPLIVDRTIEAHVLIGSAQGAGAWGATRRDWYDGEGQFPRQAIERIIRERGVGWWNARWPLYGPEGVVEVQFERVKRAFAHIPGVRVDGAKFTGAGVHEQARTLGERAPAGIASTDMLQMLEWWGGIGGHLDFSPVTPLRGSDAVALYELIGPMLGRAGLDYGPAFILTQRSLLHICPVLFDTLNEAQVGAAFEVYAELVRECASRGYGLYRTHLQFMDLVQEQYSWGDHAVRRFLETLKDAVDPNGILAPGKQGVWPAGLREQSASPARLGEQGGAAAFSPTAPAPRRPASDGPRPRTTR
jgi:4-cresol dehydrogenase (hydroxylating)